MSESNPEKKRKKTPTADGVARLTSLRRQVIGALILFLFAFFCGRGVETSSRPNCRRRKSRFRRARFLPATIPVEVDLPPIESSNFEPEFELESESESNPESKSESESEAEDASGDSISAQAAAALPASVSARAVESESSEAESSEESLAAGARKPFVAQVIAVADRARARATLSQLAADFEGGHLQRIEDGGGGVLYRVGFGYDTIEAAERAKTLLRKLGYEKAFVRENPPR